MSFDQREWVNDMVTGAITGVWGGVVGAMSVPNPPFLDLMAIGGIGGFVLGMMVQPLKWLLNRRPRATDPPVSPPRDPDAPRQDSSPRQVVRPKTEDFSS